MFIFMAINRAIGFIFSRFVFRDPVHNNVEALIGIKCITDTYRILFSTNESVSELLGRRIVYTGIGICFESLPQMVLQMTIVLTNIKNKRLDSGLLAAQIACVLSSCFAIGLSLGSANFDYALAVTIPGELKHPSMAKFLPRDDLFRQTLIYASMVVWYSLHVLIFGFGYSCLFAFATLGISISIFFGNMVLFTIIRYIVNNAGWRSLDVYSITNDNIRIITLPLYCVFVYIGTMSVPVCLWRFQNLMGTIPTTWAWISALLISSTSIFIFIDDVSVKTLFIIILVIYAINLVVFFTNIKRDQIHTFFWSTVNW